MTRTQIQLPDILFAQVRKFADAREMSLAEVCRRALELYLNVSAPVRDGETGKDEEWHLPIARDTGPMLCDPFEDPEWRYNLHKRRFEEELEAEAAAGRHTSASVAEAAVPYDSDEMSQRSAGA